MGFLGAIGDAIWGSAARRAKGRYIREGAAQNIRDIEAQQVWRGAEDPRERAHQKQSVFARGLGKSSIERQERARLDLMQSQRNTRLAQQLDLAKWYKLYVDRQARYEEISQYLSLADQIVGVVAGAAVGGVGGALAAGVFGGGSSGDGGGGDYLEAQPQYRHGPGEYNYGSSG